MCTKTFCILEAVHATAASAKTGLPTILPSHLRPPSLSFARNLIPAPKLVIFIVLFDLLLRPWSISERGQVVESEATSAPEQRHPCPGRKALGTRTFYPYILSPLASLQSRSTSSFAHLCSLPFDICTFAVVLCL